MSLLPQIAKKRGRDATGVEETNVDNQDTDRLWGEPTKRHVDKQDGPNDETWR